MTINETLAHASVLVIYIIICYITRICLFPVTVTRDNNTPLAYIFTNFALNIL